MNRAPDARAHRLKAWLARFEVDRAISFALASRAWQSIAGPVTALLIASCFTTELQGYYFTFSSLMGLQIFAELGFQWVIVHVASHEWAELVLDGQKVPRGNPAALARLASLSRLAVSWYFVAAICFVPVVSFLGYSFFSSKATAIPWLGPWITLVALTGASFCLSALVAILEGCNQVETVQRYRLGQALAGNFVVWSLILGGAGLWAAVAASGVQFLWELWLAFGVYRRFWQVLWRVPLTPHSRMSWRNDVWPLQWRIAAQSIFHYFGYQIFVPVMFYYHSAELAGQMGMTWTILAACQSIAFTWLQMRAPQLGMLVAQHSFGELDRMFWRLVRVSSAVLCTAVAVFCVGAALLDQIPLELGQKLAQRILPPWSVLVLGVGVALVHVPRCLSLYLRAHKRDPLLGTFVLGNSLLGLTVFLLGSRSGALAAACGFLLTVAFVQVPLSLLVWLRCRREWHAAADEPAPPTVSVSPEGVTGKTSP